MLERRSKCRGYRIGRTGGGRVLTYVLALLGLVLCVGVLGPVTVGHAADKVAIYFYYPGGEGSSVEAAPLMEAFAKGVSEASGVSVTASYTSSRVPLKTLVKQPKTSLVLMRLDSYLEADPSMAFDPTLMTEVARGSGQRPVYHIYGGKRPAGTPGVGAPCSTLYLGLDLSPAFIGHIFGAPWKTVKTVLSEAPLDQLETIANASTAGKATGDCLLLEMRQWQALQSVPFSWKESLSLVQVSAPTLPPLLCRVGASPPAVQKVIDALQKMGGDDQYREVLDDLEVLRFVPPSPEEFRWLGEWKARYAATSQK